MKIFLVIVLFTALTACKKSDSSTNGNYCWHCITNGSNPNVTKDTCTPTANLGQFIWVSPQGNDYQYSCYPK